MKQAGEITICDPGSDKPILEAGTLQCVHCGAHWQIRPGSGKIRGFCSRCNGPVCGPKCAECVPAELQLDNMEKGRALNFRPVMVTSKLYLPRLD
jgi:hypothetical protein